jgi:hypothetical protein
MLRFATQRLATLAAACAIATPAFAWDYPGHRMVGWIADLVLQQHYPKTREKVSALLDVKDASGNVTDKRFLREVAVFPDCAKDEEEYCGRRPSQEERDYAARNKEHRGYHFTNTPLQFDKYDPDGKWAKPTDIVHMIAYTVAQLKGEKPATPPKDVVDLTDTEALWLLAHLVGDIHQPLHVGAKYYDATCEKDADLNKDEPVAVTLGGNRIEIPATPPAVPVAPNLHIYWDAAAVARAMRSAGMAGAEQAFARLLAASPPAGWKTEGAPETWASQWATEILPLARQAHDLLVIRKSAKVPFPSTSNPCMWETTLDPPYQDWAKEVACAQIAKAGFRLAALLVAIFPNESAK